jgi:tRNA-splicing ligase RtcB (3'-phosphate/5'-hydroxy nucleic acid ligase)
MVKLNGKYEEAVVYNDDVESVAISQIVNLLNQPFAENSHVRVMSDVHAGAGCVIGYTAKLTDKIVPNLIGVDIGCGVTAWKLGKRSTIGEKFDKLDSIIKHLVPSGKDVHSSSPNFLDFERILSQFSNVSFDDLHEKVTNICRKTSQDEKRVWQSIGTLGGGNHFIEIDQDNNDELWLVIHSGSRNFGLKIAKYHQTIAEDSLLSISKEEYDKRVKEIKQKKKGKGIEVAINALRKEASQKGKASGLEYIEGQDAINYYEDMKVAQIYSQLNRRIMGYKILNKMYKIDYFEPVESIHNYINFNDNIIRKGSISAHSGEEVIIPLNMKKGCVVGVGLGNPDYNYSAPHGAGRKMSRSKAKQNISLEKYQKDMKDVWSSCVNENTLDESPAAYKDADKIIEYMKDTVRVTNTLKSIYNFKASE